ncbi:MAG TPA: sigma 54-interacting transcriptional regulator [Vicinamibacterales bacterium]|nr:sigma 54-interacting transcriptional regulator [Vicinamibacterales bacterium]
MQWLADRFFIDDGRWRDAASGAPVHILIEDRQPDDALDWDEQCARMANARHPLLNALLDYGDAPGGRRFEAYETAPDLQAGGVQGERALLHATQFLRASGIAPTSARCRYAMRAVTPGRSGSIRALGITLQPRRALEAVQEALDSGPAAGPVVLGVTGSAHAGLRTLRMLIARAARLRGFVPVCASLLGEGGPLGRLPHDRHLCVLDDVGDRKRRGREVAAQLIAMAAATARGYVLIRFQRERTSAATIPLELMSVRSLVGMVFVESPDSPGQEEMFAAARAAEGRPGAFVARLEGNHFDRPRWTMVVHERPEAYLVQPAVAAPRGRPARTLTTALRAASRAAALARVGRHAAATRALLRSSRVLDGRGRAEEAAHSLVLAGRLALARGHTCEAASRFEQARLRSGAGAAAFLAAAGLAEAWIADARLTEAEALLRGSLAAAETLGDLRSASIIAAVLVAALHTQGRDGDGIALASMREWSDGPEESAALQAATARCHAAVGRIATAMRLARAAQASAALSEQPALLAGVALCLADVLASAGDTVGMAAALAGARDIARRAHLPLLLAHARLTEWEHLKGGAGSGLRLRRELTALGRLALPRSLRERLDAALAQPDHGPCGPSVPGLTTVPDAHRAGADALESLLQERQHAADDPAAVAAVCATLVRRLDAASAMILSAADRRVLALEGRPWVAHSTVVEQALTTGMPVATDAGCEPREAAEPLRYGGEIIAVLACRWTAGAIVDGYGAAGILHAAALAAAASVRAVLDRAVSALPDGAWSDLLGDSAAATTLREAVSRAARAPFPVLVEGESGCGKELVARAIHKLGPRRDRRFCAINCAALTDELVEAELFGHARGAFTGAAAERAGLFEEADGGTLFLDEVGELSARAQAKLLRVLQEGEVRRVGENFSRRVDARIVAATNRRLEEEVTAGRFRADLRFRLDVVRITVPPLRERPGDIPLLAAHFWNEASTRVGSRATLSGDALAALARHDWPGNVRELQNVMAWMAVQSPMRGRIGSAALPANVARAVVPTGSGFGAARDEFERRFIRAALAGAHGQRAKAAEVLGVTRQGLAKMMRRLRIEVSS